MLWYWTLNYRVYWNSPNFGLRLHQQIPTMELQATMGYVGKVLFRYLGLLLHVCCQVRIWHLYWCPSCVRCLALRASETAVFDCAAVCALRSLFAQMSPREFIVGCKLCRLSAIILFSLFSTLSGISPANRSRYRPKSVHMHRQGPTTFTKFWARSAKWGRNEGSKVSPMPVFLSAIRDHFSATSQRLIFAKFGHGTWIVVETQILDKFMKSFHSGVICPQNPKLWGGQTGTSLIVCYRSRDALQRDTVYSTFYSPRAREFPISVNFFVGRTVAELRGFKVAQFSDFGLFSPYKTPKTYLPVTSLQPRGYIAKWFRFLCDSRRSKGVPSGSGVFMWLLAGELGTPQTCPNFRL